MIFITLGTQNFPLDRLLIYVDELCANKRITEDVFAQIGHSIYRPKFFSYVDFLEHEKMINKINESSLVITHSGVGSILAAIQAKKPVIVFPRLKKYKEHVDNHQMEIAEAFEKKNLVLLCREKDDLGQLVQKAKKHFFSTYQSSTDRIINIIKESLGGVRD